MLRVLWCITKTTLLNMGFIPLRSNLKYGWKSRILSTEDKNGDESGKIKNTYWDDGYLLWITIGVILIVYSGDRNIYKRMKKKLMNREKYVFYKLNLNKLR